MRRAAFIAVLVIVALAQTPSAATASQKSRGGRRASPRASKKKGTGALLKGTWGGQHIALHVGEAGARVEYDCGRGTVDGPFKTAPDGRFDLRGTHTEERGGPVRAPHIREEDGSGAASASGAGRPARYVGRVEGRSMTLTVTLVDTGEEIGTFSLAHGREPELVRCY